MLSWALNAEEAESIQQAKIKALSFLVGNWAGEGKSYDAQGQVSTYFDTEDVWFDVEESLLIIQAKGFRDEKQFYGIHTVIYFDEQAGHYWYNPYTAKGARAFSCELIEQQFLCYSPEKTFRLIFRRTSTGQWNEFGERLTDGQWKKTFETILDKAKLS